MSTLSVPTPPPTVAPAALLTAEEFAARHAHVHAELVKGVLQEYPVPMPKHGKLCLTIGRLIGNHVDEHDLGHVMSNDSWIRTGSNPDTVRGADVSYYSYERLPRGDVPEGLLAVVPDLVVEGRSPGDRWMDCSSRSASTCGRASAWWWCSTRSRRRRRCTGPTNCNRCCTTATR